jgi:hypothetical protein
MGKLQDIITIKLTSSSEKEDKEQLLGASPTTNTFCGS